MSRDLARIQINDWMDYRDALLLSGHLWEQLTMQEQSSYTPGVRVQRPRRISVFDGQDLKKAVLSGAASLEEHREIINALNVFPVPDGDTGSNMYATVQAAFRDVINCEDTCTVANRLEPVSPSGTGKTLRRSEEHTSELQSLTNLVC